MLSGVQFIPVGRLHHNSFMLPGEQHSGAGNGLTVTILQNILINNSNMSPLLYVHPSIRLSRSPHGVSSQHAPLRQQITQRCCFYLDRKRHLSTLLFKFSFGLIHLILDWTWTDNIWTIYTKWHWLWINMLAQNCNQTSKSRCDWMDDIFKIQASTIL